MKKCVVPLLAAIMVNACIPSSFDECGEYPEIYPDYVGVTVPEGIAPLEFRMADGRKMTKNIERSADTIFVTVSAWRRGDRSGVRYAPFPIFVSRDSIDPYVAYRLIEPGYESWHDMGIYQRSLATYEETAIVTNRSNGGGCVNCHNFDSYDPERMLFHSRCSNGGTVFALNGQTNLFNLAVTGPGKQGTYPAWHPSGRYVVFSSNDTHQCFTAGNIQPIEVYDTSSDLIMLDLEGGTVECPEVFRTDDRLETFPSWSEDGKVLYFCVSEAVDSLPEKRGELRYRIVASDFADGRFSEPRTVLESDTLSFSFPRIRGGWMMLTAADFGTFPIWHREADLMMFDPVSGEFRRADELNSEFTESYHSWSSNGKWVIFSSRRLDGRYTRLFIAHHRGDGTFDKPFLLPQKNPDYDVLRLKSYNIPEFICGKAPRLDDSFSKLSE